MPSISSQPIHCIRINPSLLPHALESIKCEAHGASIMQKKGEVLLFLLRDLTPPQLHILKQELLSVGGDLATPKEAILSKASYYDALIIATKSQLERVIYKCKQQPFSLKALSATLQAHLTSTKHPSSNANSHNATSTHSSSSLLAQSPLIMPIINLTSDSFYAPSRHNSAQALHAIEHLINQGARVIDIGAASSRPGSPYISADEEITRLRDVCAYIKQEHLAKKARFSIDTYNAKTAAYALDAGFSIINDVSALHDANMLAVVRDFHADFILMHTRGMPDSMMMQCDYRHIISDIDTFFIQKLEVLEAHNVGEVVLDIGFGFAKNSAQNLSLIQHLRHFKHFHKALLVGASQKSTIGEITHEKDPAHRLSGTLSLHLLALQQGANIIRAHHYKEHVDMLRMFNAFHSAPCSLELL